MNTKTSFLIVEDEVLTSLLYQKTLNKYGITEIERVGSAEAAIRSFQDSPVDIVFMDINLAGDMNGIEAARRIQDLGDPKIVFITGYQDEAIQHEAETLSPAGFFIKPVEMAKILALLQD